MKRRAIVWLRHDLRLHDNEAISTALRMAEEVIPVYILMNGYLTVSLVSVFRRPANFGRNLFSNVWPICEKACVR